MMDQLDEPGAVGQISQIIRTMNVGEECFIGQHVRNSNSFFWDEETWALLFTVIPEISDGDPEVKKSAIQFHKLRKKQALCTEQDAYTGVHSAC